MTLTLNQTSLRKAVLTAVLGATIFVAPAVASAACSKNDIKGTWWFYKHFFKDGNPLTGWTRCKLVIKKKNGNVAGGQPCVDFDGTTANMRSGGKLSIDKKCNVTGTLLLGGVNQETLTIQHSQMDDSGKKSMSGVGKDNFAFYFVFDAVKEGKKGKRN